MSFRQYDSQIETHKSPAWIARAVPAWRIADTVFRQMQLLHPHHPAAAQHYESVLLDIFVGPPQRRGVAAFYRFQPDNTHVLEVPLTALAVIGGRLHVEEKTAGQITACWYGALRIQPARLRDGGPQPRRSALATAFRQLRDAFDAHISPDYPPQPLSRIVKENPAIAKPHLPVNLIRSKIETALKQQEETFVCQSQVFALYPDFKLDGRDVWVQGESAKRMAALFAPAKIRETVTV
jgi:hypothetical protein